MRDIYLIVVMGLPLTIALSFGLAWTICSLYQWISEKCRGPVEFEPVELSVLRSVTGWVEPPSIECLLLNERVLVPLDGPSDTYSTASTIRIDDCEMVGETNEAEKKNVETRKKSKKTVTISESAMQIV